MVDITKIAAIYADAERYGGMIASTWLDRPLSAAGRVMVRENGRIAEKLVNIERYLMMIPSVAIHMERGVNDGKKFDPNTDMLPVISAADAKNSLRALAAKNAGVSEDDILSTDLFLYPRTPGTVWGADEEFVSSPRLDDLQCVFACLNGFLGAKPAESAAVLCVFDNEEVGSGTKQGADSTFLEDTLVRVCEALGRSGAEYRAALNQSFMVSADNAHAVHPNHPEFADRIDRPAINGGIVIKFNANQKYTTDSVSAAVFAELCRDAGVPVQRFTNRADMPGGSTLGNISSAHVSVDTVDIGLPQLAMHSCYETAGARDTEYLIRAARELFSRSFRRGRNGIEI
jgi:aspartyl aminopeptidase